MGKLTELAERCEKAMERVPEWVKHDLTPAQLTFYRQQRREIVEQVERDARLAGGWAELACGYLTTIADNSPPLGGLHHTLHIISAALRARTQNTPDSQRGGA